jgi:hypothetical protein
MKPMGESLLRSWSRHSAVSERRLKNEGICGGFARDFERDRYSGVEIRVPRFIIIVIL